MEQAYRNGMPLPDKIANAPELEEGLECYYAAFLDLNSCRALGPHGEGAIPWTTISQYASFHNYQGEELEDLFYHTQRLDKVYLDWSIKKAKERAARNKPPPKRAPRKR